MLTGRPAAGERARAVVGRTGTWAAAAAGAAGAVAVVAVGGVGLISAPVSLRARAADERRYACASPSL